MVFNWRDAIVYSVVVDRFSDGNPANNPGSDSESNRGADPPAQWKGGDLRGLLNKIDEGYFTDLGVNVLWLTPPFTNQTRVGHGVGINLGRNSSAYHGFWPKDLTTVDARIGDNALLKEVIAHAHAKGLKILIDYVMHHVSIESDLWRQQRQDDWFWSIDGVPGAGWIKGVPSGYCVCHGDEDSGATTTCGWDDPDTTRRCWFATYLSTFDFRKPEARAFSVSNAVHWVREFQFDGYRLDAVKHIEKQWLIDFREAMSSISARNFYVVGEVFSEDRKLIADFIEPGTLLDGQFDFALRSEILRTVIAEEGTLADLDAALNQSSEYGPQALMCTFLSSYDLPRVISVADLPSRKRLGSHPQSWRGRGNGALAWTEDLALPADRAAFARTLLAYTVIMTNPGIPVVYYGDECGMPGAGDPDNRRTMECFRSLNENQLWLNQRLKRLIKIRNEEAALRHGIRHRLEAGKDLYVYRMAGEGYRDVFVMINRSTNDQRAAMLPAGEYHDLLNGEAVKTPVAALALTARVLVRK